MRKMSRYSASASARWAILCCLFFFNAAALYLHVYDDVFKQHERAAVRGGVVNRYREEFLKSSQRGDKRKCRFKKRRKMATAR